MGPPRKVAYNMRMPPGMPARMALVCVLASAGVGHADPDRVERRRVAVIVLSESGDSGTKELAQRYYNTLLAHWALQPLGLPALDAALQNPLEDENKPNLDRARADKAAADDALVQLEYKKAEEAALDGEVALTSVTPSADVIALHAELALAQGRAELFLNNPNGASLAFGLTHRLDPGKQLDPKNYDPDVLSAYDRAKATTRAKLKVPITGSGRIWLDGVDVAEAPATIEIEIGQHVVQLTGLERITRGKSVVIEQGAHIEIADDPASDVRVAEQVRVEEALVVPHVQIGFRAVVGNEHLPVLERVHGARVDVEVRVKLLHRDPQPTQLEQAAEARCGQSLAEAGGDASGDKEMSGLHRP